MNSDSIQFIYFDLDDTLLDHRHAERLGLADVYGQFADHFAGVSLDTLQETYHQHSVVLWRQYAASEITKDEIKRLRFENTFSSLGIYGLDGRAVNDIYLQCYANHWVLPAEARFAFHAIADHYRVGIITNGFVEIQHLKFDTFPELGERAEALIISEEVGYMKPHPQIFRHAQDLAQTPAETILYVGDSYSSDVRGGLAAGWQVAWYTAQPTDHENGVFNFQQWDALTQQLLG